MSDFAGLFFDINIFIDFICHDKKSLPFNLLIKEEKISMNNNLGCCNKCKNLVPATQKEKDGKVYLVKDCPECGQTETLISADSKRYFNKRDLDANHTYRKCDLDCMACKHKNPNIIFIDVTNRCNLNCPVCINNTPSMGFTFEPPLEYFEKIFKHYSQLEPRPSVQLFGGEPTVRKDILDLIKLARKYKLSVRVTTNGIKLADEDFCRKIIENRATILIAYDGENKKLYEKLRGNSSMLEKKKKAFENIDKIGNAKVVIMSLVAKGYNAETLPEMFEFCHKYRQNIRGLYLIPFTETSNTVHMNLEVPRITTEDIEIIFNDAFPNERIDFLPAGFLGELPTFMKCLKIKALPFVGAHPNCESVYILVSDGEKYVPLARYLKGTTLSLCKDLLKAEEKLAAKYESYFKNKLKDKKKTFKDKLIYASAFLSMFNVFRKNFKFGKLIKGRGLGKFGSLLMLLSGLLTGAKTNTLLAKYTKFQSVLQIIILPFEDVSNRESERLSRCPAAFVYLDPADDKVKQIPVCIWGVYKDETLKRITEHYKTKTEI